MIKIVKKVCLVKTTKKFGELNKKYYFCITKNDKHMTTTSTTTEKNIIKLTEGILAGDIFYGSFETNVDDKKISVMVSNNIKDLNQEYEFRVAGKCKAGFINIHDIKGTPRSVITAYAKNTLVNIQVNCVYKNGVELWHNVLTTKGNKWYSIDKAFLDVLTVGNMRKTFPNMCDSKIWEKMGAKTWADKAFTQN